MKSCSICILGEDNRMDYAAEYLYNYGYEIYRDEIDLEYSQAVVLPPVYGKVDMFTDNHIIFCGNIPDDTDKEKYTIYNYLNDKDFVEYNSMLTAKGIYDECENDYKNMNNKKILVLGYGSCGKAICEYYKDKCADIAVMVRKKELKKDIAKKGFSYFNFASYKANDLKDYDIIINTVPALVVDKAMIDCFNGKTSVYDIASKNGGTDFYYCKLKQIRANQYLKIPGKKYPKEAGEAIAKYVIKKLESIL